MKESSESQGHMWNDSVKDRLNLKFDDISSSQWVQVLLLQFSWTNDLTFMQQKLLLQSVKGFKSEAKLSVLGLSEIKFSFKLEQKTHRYRNILKNIYIYLKFLYLSNFYVLDIVV